MQEYVALEGTSNSHFDCCIFLFITNQTRQVEKQGSAEVSLFPLFPQLTGLDIGPDDTAYVAHIHHNRNKGFYGLHAQGPSVHTVHIAGHTEV